MTAAPVVSTCTQPTFLAPNTPGTDVQSFKFGSYYRRSGCLQSEQNSPAQINLPFADPSVPLVTSHVFLYKSFSVRRPLLSEFLLLTFPPPRQVIRSILTYSIRLISGRDDFALASYP